MKLADHLSIWAQSFVMSVLLIGGAASINYACTPRQQAKFANVAELLCDELEDFDHLKHAIVSINLLMERGDYGEALRAADALLDAFDESQDVPGLRELRALIFLLQSLQETPYE
jgi:hypothetical protein